MQIAILVAVHSYAIIGKEYGTQEMLAWNRLCTWDSAARVVPESREMSLGSKAAWTAGSSTSIRCTVSDTGSASSQATIIRVSVWYQYLGTGPARLPGTVGISSGT